MGGVFPCPILQSASIAPISYQSYSLCPQVFMKPAANDSTLKQKTFTTFLATPSCRYSTSEPTTPGLMDGSLLKFFGLDTATNRSLQGQDMRNADVVIMLAQQTDHLRNLSLEL
jgi:hypothetical protein